MICNETIFFAQTIMVSLAALVALRLGKAALVAFICTACLLANLFVVKQITLFGLCATGSDAFTIGATLALNLLQEYYGRTITKQTIWINFFLLVFYAIMSQIHLAYLSNPFDTAHQHFEPLFAIMPRIVIASFVVYLIAQMADYLLYGLFKRICNDRFLVIRNYGSMTLSQLIDTVLFSFFGLAGIIHNLGEVMVVSYAIKLVAIALATPTVMLARFIVVKEHDHA